MMSLSDVKTVQDNWQGFVVSSSIRKFVLGNCTSISLLIDFTIFQLILYLQQNLNYPNLIDKREVFKKNIWKDLHKKTLYRTCTVNLMYKKNSLMLFNYTVVLPNFSHPDRLLVTIIQMQFIYNHDALWNRRNCIII